MAWTCYSCGTKNSNKDDTCTKCGGNVAAPRSFYIHWIFGGAAFFFITYVTGVFIGGTLVEVSVSPEEAEVLAVAKSMGFSAKSALELKPEEAKAAKKQVTDKARAEMSPVLRNLLYWFIPFLLFIVCGAIVGFVSDGKTILESGIGSAVGQIGGFAVLIYGLGYELSVLTLFVGLVIGFGLAMVGAWLGENLQDRRERAVG